MYGKKKVTGTALGIPGGVGLGIVVSLLITLAGAALAAWLIASEKIGEGSIGYAAMVILALASASGALVAVLLTKRLRLQVCMLTGGCIRGWGYPLLLSLPCVRLLLFCLQKMAGAA